MSRHRVSAYDDPFERGGRSDASGWLVIGVSLGDLSNTAPDRATAASALVGRLACAAHAGLLLASALTETSAPRSYPEAGAELCGGLLRQDPLEPLAEPG